MLIPQRYRRSVELRLLRYFIAVAEERHVGRAAGRLSMTQPPLSRALRRLENELGAQLLERTPKGVELTAAGTILYDEATALLEHADRLQQRVTATASMAVIAVGTLADAAEQVGATLVAAFRRQQPNVDVVIHEADLSNPTAGLRAGLVDVALTRTPFDARGISSYVLRSDPIGVVMHDDDPLARCDAVAVDELTDRRWVRLPYSTDATFRAYWTVQGPQSADLPVVKTIQECLQSVLWNGASALAPLNQTLPRGLRLVPVSDRAASELVVAWRGTDPGPLVRSFVEIAAATYRAP